MAALEGDAEQRSLDGGPAESTQKRLSLSWRGSSWGSSPALIPGAGADGEGDSRSRMRPPRTRSLSTVAGSAEYWKESVRPREGWESDFPLHLGKTKGEVKTRGFCPEEK